MFRNFRVRSIYIFIRFSPTISGHPVRLPPHQSRMYSLKNLSVARPLVALALHLLHNLQHGLVQRVTGLEPVHLGHNLGRAVGLQDRCQLNRLVITLDILEQERLLDSGEQAIHLVASLGQLRGGPDQAFLARQFPQRRAADALDAIFQGRIAEAAHDLVDVVVLLFGGDAVLLHDENGRLTQDVAHDIVDLLVYHGVVDQLLAALLAVVGGGGVARVDGEELALDEGLEVVDEMDALDVRVADAVEGGLLDAPFVELFDFDVEARVGVLVGHDAVDGAVGEARFGVNVVLGSVAEFVEDEAFQRVGSVDGVLARDDGDRVVQFAVLNAPGDDGTDELENVWANGAGDEVSGGDLLDHFLLLVLGVDGPVIVDGEDALAVLANLDDLVGGLGLEGVNNAVQDIDKDDFISRVVEELGDEAAAQREQIWVQVWGGGDDVPANVTTAEVDGLLSGHCE